MIIITGTVRIPAGSIEKVKPAMEEMIAASRAERGCLAYSYALDVLDDGLVHVHEAWTDQVALDAHFETSHLKAWRAKWALLGISDRQLVAFEVDAPMAI
ncbi:MAG: putative quinol monooxygenase [Pseudomonadota bacterium]